MTRNCDPVFDVDWKNIKIWKTKNKQAKKNAFGNRVIRIKASISLMETVPWITQRCINVIRESLSNWLDIYWRRETDMRLTLALSWQNKELFPWQLPYFVVIVVIIIVVVVILRHGASLKLS